VEGAAQASGSNSVEYREDVWVERIQQPPITIPRLNHPCLYRVTAHCFVGQGRIAVNPAWPALFRFQMSTSGFGGQQFNPKRWQRETRGPDRVSLPALTSPRLAL
jgi:hypothetical protein